MDGSYSFYKDKKPFRWIYTAAWEKSKLIST